MKLKPNWSLGLTDVFDYVRPPRLSSFSFASCCSLISHFQFHPARRDVFRRMWVSLTSHSLKHVSHPPRLEICMWRTSGPSFTNIRGTEVVIWREEHTKKSGRPFLLTVWLAQCWQRDGLRNKCVLDPTELSRVGIHKCFCYFPV